MVSSSKLYTVILFFNESTIQYSLTPAVRYLKQLYHVIHSLTAWRYNFNHPVRCPIAPFIVQLIRIANHRYIRLYIILVIFIQKNQQTALNIHRKSPYYYQYNYILLYLMLLIFFDELLTAVPCRIFSLNQFCTFSGW